MADNDIKTLAANVKFLIAKVVAIETVMRASPMAWSDEKRADMEVADAVNDCNRLIKLLDEYVAKNKGKPWMGYDIISHILVVQIDGAKLKVDAANAKLAAVKASTAAAAAAENVSDFDGVLSRLEIEAGLKKE